MLIRGSERWLICKTHEPSITKSQPWPNILDRGLIASGLLVGNQRYKQTRIREGIMAIVYERLGCLEEARWGLVNSLKSGTPGRNRKRCKRAVQRKEFVAVIGFQHSRFRSFKSEKIYYAIITAHLQDATSVSDRGHSGRGTLSCLAD